jgi:hypothetical protein
MEVIFMTENKINERNRKTQVESHATAALFSNNGTYTDLAGVYIPSEQEVILAKDYVDENEK